MIRCNSSTFFWQLSDFKNKVVIFKEETKAVFHAPTNPTHMWHRPESNLGDISEKRMLSPLHHPFSSPGLLRSRFLGCHATLPVAWHPKKRTAAKETNVQQDLWYSTSFMFASWQLLLTQNSSGSLKCPVESRRQQREVQKICQKLVKDLSKTLSTGRGNESNGNLRKFFSKAVSESTFPLSSKS